MLTLEDFLGPFDVNFDVPEDSEFVFDYDTLPDPPQMLTTGSLVITKAEHQYDGYARVDELHFHATQRVYRQLGLLALATLFSEGCSQATLALTHPKSAISQLVIDAMRPDKAKLETGFSMIPYAYSYWPDTVEKHHWLNDGLSPQELPFFGLTSADGFHATDEEWEARDVVRGFGRPEATARLAQLLLDVSRPTCPINEVQLEGELGFRGVAPGSAEVRLWLPGSFGYATEFALE
jgi:hypothetical protein